MEKSLQGSDGKKKKVKQEWREADVKKGEKWATIKMNEYWIQVLRQGPYHKAFAVRMAMTKLQCTSN